MVVALTAAHRCPKPGVGEVAYAVGRVLGEVLLHLHASLVRGLQQAIVAAGDFLVHRRVGQQVAGKLLGGELVERQIVIERLDDPVAVRRDRMILIAVVTDGVGVTDEIKPVTGQALAKPRRRQQFVHHARIGLRRLVVG